MTFFLKEQEQTQPNPAPREAAGFFEIIGAGWEAEEVETNVNDQVVRTRQRFIDGLADKHWEKIRENLDGFRYRLDTEGQLTARQQMAVYGLRRLREADPENFGWLDMSDEAIERTVNQMLRARYQDAQDTLAMGGRGSGLAEFIGRGGRAMTDPTNLALAALTGGGGGVARVTAREALAGGVAEGLVLPKQFEMAERLEIEDPNPLAQVAFGAGLGGALGAGLSATGRYLEYRKERRAQAGEAAELAGGDPVDHAARIEAAQDALDGRAPRGGDAAPDTAEEAGAAVIRPKQGQSVRLVPQGATQSEKGFLDTIARYEGTDKGDGYNETLGYGAYTGGDVNLTGMTLNEVMELQGQMLRHPDNTFNSSAVGRYQIVRKTLRGLIADMGLTGNELFSPALQDAMAIRLAKGRGRSPAALRNEWEGFRRASDAEILAAWDAGLHSSGEVSSFTGGTRRGFTAPDEVTTPGGLTAKVEYIVVDANDLKFATGDLQPRDRTRAASDEQISEIAARLDPARLGPSPEADRGAPITSPDGEIESGNGRVRAILKAREQFPDRYAAYRQELADTWGIPDGVETPVLVARRTSGMSQAERVAFVNDANTSGIARMSATERSRSDARAMTAGVLGLYRPGAGLASAANRDFARAFLDRLPQSERAGLVSRDGTLNAEGQDRVRQAAFAAAYGDERLIARFAEEGGGEVKAINEALAEVAADWGRLRADVADGLVDPALDVTDRLVDAVAMIVEARALAKREKISVGAALDEMVNTGDLMDGATDPVTAGFVNIFYSGNRARSSEDVAEILRDYVTEAQRVGKTEAKLFGDDLTARPQEVLDAVRPEQNDLLAARPGDPAGPRDGEARQAPEGQDPAEGGGRGQARDAAADAGDQDPRVTAELPPGVAEGAPNADAIDPQQFDEGAASPAAERAVDAAQDDLRAWIEAEGDFRLSEAEDAPSARDLLDEVEADTNLSEVLNLCNPGGRANG